MRGQHPHRLAARDAPRQCALAQAASALIHSKRWAGAASGAACRTPWRSLRLCGSAGRPLRTGVLRRPLRPCVLRRPLWLRGSLHAAPAHKSHAMALNKCKAKGCTGVTALNQRARICLKHYQRRNPSAKASHVEFAGMSTDSSSPKALATCVPVHGDALLSCTKTAARPGCCNTMQHKLHHAWCVHTAQPRPTRSVKNKKKEPYRHVARLKCRAGRTPARPAPAAARRAAPAPAAAARTTAPAPAGPGRRSAGPGRRLAGPGRC